jgi:hypothetical protein
MFTLITTLATGNFNNGVVIRPNGFTLSKKDNGPVLFEKDNGPGLFEKTTGPDFPKKTSNVSALLISIDAIVLKSV